MTDLVLVAWISSAPAWGALAMAVVNNMMSRKHAAESKIAISALAEQTNGVSEKLLKVTGESERAAGKLEGAAQELARGSAIRQEAAAACDKGDCPLK